MEIKFYSAQELKDLRHQLRMTQTEFATRIGYTRETIAQIEIGKNKMSTAMANSIYLLLKDMLPTPRPDFFKDFNDNKIFDEIIEAIKNNNDLLLRILKMVKQ